MILFKGKTIDLEKSSHTCDSVRISVSDLCVCGFILTLQQASRFDKKVLNQYGKEITNSRNDWSL